MFCLAIAAAGCSTQPDAPSVPQGTPVCGTLVDGLFYDCEGNVTLVQGTEFPIQDMPFGWTCLDSVNFPVTAVGGGRSGAFAADLYTDLGGRFGIKLSWHTSADDDPYHLRAVFTDGRQAPQTDLWFPTNDGALHAWIPYQAEAGQTEGLWGIAATEVQARAVDGSTLPGFHLAIHDDLTTMRYVFIADGENGTARALGMLARDSFWVRPDGTSYNPPEPASQEDPPILLASSASFVDDWSLTEAAINAPSCVLDSLPAS